VKLSNSPAITYVPRLDLDDFESQSDTIRINQRFPSVFVGGGIFSTATDAGIPSKLKLKTQ
jgi:hypothetical protein